MLTNQLRALEQDGLITRTVFPEVPPRVEYAATLLAHDLKDVFFAMRDWWKRHHPSRLLKNSTADGVVRI
jgi:DNA-binding HxlR family transcriptional regulator